MKLMCRISKAFSIFALAAFIAGTAVAADTLPKLELKPAYPNLKFNRPLAMIEAPDGSHRRFVMEQDGHIWILPKDPNGSDPKLFLDISDRQPFQQNEEGLLSFAFHPDFKKNGKLYLFYSHPSPPKHNMIAEWQVSKTDPDKADPTTERILLKIKKPDDETFWNHNGGTVAFGPDGYLYLGIGDGGVGYDPYDAAQKINNLFGKIIRIDVNTKTPGLEYGIPKDNPFVDESKQAELKADPMNQTLNITRQEIYAYGVRNPWRMSFDRQTGELYVGDVGQELWEEVDIIKKGGNYGWSAREGFHEMNQQRGTNHIVRGSEPIDPIIEYAHRENMAPQGKFPNHTTGICITGGYVYRGKKFPALQGVYLYGDYQYGTIWGLRYENGKITADDIVVHGNMRRTLPSFAEDADGELYVLSFDGNIYQFVEPAPAAPAPAAAN